jgi:transcriptional regulator with XRE-family HTH domain
MPVDRDQCLPLKRVVEKSAYKKVGAAVRRQRERLGFSQEGFSQFAGIDRARWGRLERGELNISLKTLFQVAAFLRVKPSALLEDVTLEECGIDGQVD